MYDEKNKHISLTQACFAHSTAQEYQLRPNVTESGCIFPSRDICYLQTFCCSRHYTEIRHV